MQLELWNGARGGHEKRVLQRFAEVLPALPMDEEVWSSAQDLARCAHSRGVTVPATDIALAACARRHGAGLESADANFELLTGIGAADDD